MTRSLIASIILVSSAVATADEPIRQEWRFNDKTQWAGWQPGGTIRDVKFDASSVSFRAEGSDPLITGPEFKLPASNLQWVEIELDSDTPGEGELFYTSKATGKYGGFEPHWRADLDVPHTGHRTVIAWPFWASLGQIIRLRFDPPSGHCRLYAIRIMEASPQRVAPEWDFATGEGSWRPMYAAEFEPEKNVLRVKATRPQALIFSPVAPFEASERSVLKLDASCPGEHVLSLYWTTKQEPGLFGQPIQLEAAGRITRSEAIDLRTFPQWQGTVTGLAIGFGTKGGEVLTLKSLAIAANDPSKPLLRARYIGFSNAINRPGQEADLQIILEHAAGPAFPGGVAVLDNVRSGGVTAAAPFMLPVRPRVNVPPMKPGERQTVSLPVKLLTAGRWPVRLLVNGQEFAKTIRIDEPLEGTGQSGYEVPRPQPVKTDYQIGIYYFPGWSAEQFDRWEKQKDFPERTPVLGYYAEGHPEVADWQIKWAVENALSYFVYDWYWRDGKEVLAAGLNDGFLKAQYRDLMKFALMWANHAPFDVKSREQLLQVTDYWIEHYFRRPNYLTVGGKPYVSFFAATQAVSDLGGPEKCKEALEAARRRVRDAGLPGLHIGACNATPDLAKAAGFDSLTGYNYRRTGATTLQSPYRQYLLGHEAMWEGFQKSGIMYIPLLTVGWDSRPWAGPRAEARFARRTQDFEEALGRLKAFLDAHNEKLALLEAWNEWGEGSYIEPNAEFGFGDLEAIRKVFAQPGDWPQNVTPVDVGLGNKYDLRKER